MYTKLQLDAGPQGPEAAMLYKRVKMFGIKLEALLDECTSSFWAPHTPDIR